MDINSFIINTKTEDFYEYTTNDVEKKISYIKLWVQLC